MLRIEVLTRAVACVCLCCDAYQTDDRVQTHSSEPVQSRSIHDPDLLFLHTAAADGIQRSPTHQATPKQGSQTARTSPPNEDTTRAREMQRYVQNISSESRLDGPVSVLARQPWNALTPATYSWDRQLQGLRRKTDSDMPKHSQPLPKVALPEMPVSPAPFACPLDANSTAEETTVSAISLALPPSLPAPLPFSVAWV